VDVDKFPSFFFRCIPPALGGVPAAVIRPFRHNPYAGCATPVPPVPRVLRSLSCVGAELVPCSLGDGVRPFRMASALMAFALHGSGQAGALPKFLEFGEGRGLAPACPGSVGVRGVGSAPASANIYPGWITTGAGFLPPCVDYLITSVR
jgi:hypothetical protein